MAKTHPLVTGLHVFPSKVFAQIIKCSQTNMFEDKCIKQEQGQSKTLILFSIGNWYTYLLKRVLHQFLLNHIILSFAYKSYIYPP